MFQRTTTKATHFESRFFSVLVGPLFYPFARLSRACCTRCILFLSIFDLRVGLSKNSQPTGMGYLWQCQILPRLVYTLTKDSGCGQASPVGIWTTSARWKLPYTETLAGFVGGVRFVLSTSRFLFAGAAIVCGVRLLCLFATSFSTTKPWFKTLAPCDSYGSFLFVLATD